MKCEFYDSCKVKFDSEGCFSIFCPLYVENEEELLEEQLEENCDDYEFGGGVK